jgi:hypothetical protein
MKATEVKLYEFLKKESESFFEGGHNIYTPKELVQEICNQIPNISDDKTILVLFNIEFVINLAYTLRVNTKNITFYSDHVNKTKLIQKMGVRVITSLDKNMKFDVVVGNPPYELPGTQGKKLWKEFFIKFFSLLNPQGYMAILTPSSYVKRSGQKMAAIRNIVEKNTVLYLDMDATKHFSVGEDICGIVLQSGKHNVKTRVKFDNTVELQNLTVKFDPVFGEKDVLTKGILNKVKYYPAPKLPVREDINNSQAKWVKEGKLATDRNQVYKYPVVYTPNTTHFSKELFGDKDKLKLILTIAGTYYDPKKPERNIYITTDHSGQGMCHILINTIDEGNNIKSYLTSKLFRFYIETEKTSGYNTGIKHLPKLGHSKLWTDAELYAHFGLTQEEIDYIEANVK